MLKSIKQIWNNRKQILEGMRNKWIRIPEIEEIAYDRMSICQHCPLLDIEGTNCMVPGTAPCCSACGCSLAFKTRSLSSECAHPEGPKWKSTMTEEEQDAYYTKINYNPNKDGSNI